MVYEMQKGMDLMRKKIIIGVVIWCIAAFWMMAECVYFPLTQASKIKIENKAYEQYPTLISPLKKEAIQLFYKEDEPFYPLTDSEFYMIACIVCGEAGNEPYWGKVGVASCILNACIKDNITPEEVKNLYQYSGWKDVEEFKSECMEAYGNADLADEVYEAVYQVFYNGEVLNQDILFFYNPSYGYSAFHESQQHIITIGNHKFFGLN